MASPLLQKRLFFVREQVAVLKLTDTYDILDPETKTPIGQAREEPPGYAKWLRLVMNKQLLPTRLNVYDASGALAFSIARSGIPFFVKVQVLSADGAVQGRFKAKFLAGFKVFDPAGAQVADVKGDWKGWNFKFLAANGAELGAITKKWAGLGKELFTSADNYVVSVGEGAEDRIAMLLLAAALAIDVIYSEN